MGLSKCYELRRSQVLPIDQAQAWSFFSDPRNLALITPPWMNFAIVSDSGAEIYAGQIITYRVNILPLVRVTWVTEIAHVRPQQYFVDQQQVGPYRLWHHQHLLRPHSNGTEVVDIVNYVMPYGVLGRAVHALCVGRMLGHIFDFRRRVLAERFGGELGGAYVCQ